MLNHSDAEASMQPVLDFARQSGTIGKANVVTVNSFFWGILKGFEAVPKLGQPSGSLAMSSRLVRRESFVGDDDQRRLSSTLNDILTTSQENILLSISPLFVSVTAPTMYSKRLPQSDQPQGPGAASVTPAWRDSLWHVIHLRPFDGLVAQPSLVKQTWQSTHNAFGALRDFTPGSGAYQNEADPFEPDPIGAFWGEENYRRLLQIKKEVDPTNLLTVHQGVGWIEWTKGINAILGSCAEKRPCVHMNEGWHLQLDTILRAKVQFPLSSVNVQLWSVGRADFLFYN